MKVITDMSKVMVLNGKEGLECEVWGSQMTLKLVSEYKYLGVFVNQVQMGQCR